ncbi:MAG: long-chain fatty acid--CoA ligase, partial [Proteobacteria bacterium]|nr:long-chain fatty acid--CoA ligase [Pseudomonadota bacterium]
GVVLEHRCWVFEAEAMDKLGFLSPSDKQFLWLPLSHSFGKVLEMASIRIGYPTAIDGRIDRIATNLEELQPTFVAAVPRIFEKLYNKIVTKGSRNKLSYRAFRFSQNVGQKVSAQKQQKLEPQGLLRLQNGIADLLVFRNIRAALGGRLRFFISGSAPLSADIASFFHAAGVLILEGYGLTESSAASFVNRPDDYRFGTVGKRLPGVDFKLAEADNEILLKGKGIMRGYYKLPEVNEETLSTIGEDVWLHTGDIGQVDQDGFLKIVDRKKDLIKTSGGKYVAPQKLEGKLKSMCIYISEVLVHGNTRNFCSMLITIDEESITKWAEDAKLDNLSYKELTQHEAVKQVIQGYVDALNESLASYETIKKFAILEEEFTQEGGELTPSLKVKRKAVEQKYKHILDGFYQGALKEM